MWGNGREKTWRDAEGRMGDTFLLPEGFGMVEDGALVQETKRASEWWKEEVDPEVCQMGPMTELVLSLGKTTAQIVAQFSPVPGLYPAVLFLVAIIETCEGVIYNRQAAYRVLEIIVLIYP